MLKFIFVLASLFTLQVEAQTELDTPEIRAGRAKNAAMSEAARQEANQLNTIDVYNELVRLDTARSARITLDSGWLAGHDDDQRSYGFSAVLSNRRDKGEVAASFYYGILNWKYCQALQSIISGQADKAANDCWKKTLDSFKVSSDARVPAATFNIGRMYENGLGVIASKYVAADWYVKSAEQYIKARSRDDALTSLEAALTVVPDHPSALRLRKVMLK